MRPRQGRRSRLAEDNFLLHPDQVFIRARSRSAIDQDVVAPN